MFFHTKSVPEPRWSTSAVRRVRDGLVCGRIMVGYVRIMLGSFSDRFREVWNCEVRSEKWNAKWEVWSVKWEVWTVKCEVWSVDCEVRSVKCGLWSVKCAVWSVKCEVWGLECEGSSEKWEVWSVKCGVWSLKFGVRRVQCAVWGVECRGKDTVGTGRLWTIGHLCLGNFRRRLARVYVKGYSNTTTERPWIQSPGLHHVASIFNRPGAPCPSRQRESLLELGSFSSKFSGLFQSINGDS